jgi:hypothetical protein
MATNSGTSLGYSRCGINHYTGSALGNNLMIMAVCEVAKISQNDTTLNVQLRKEQGGNRQCSVKGFLKDWSGIATCTMEAAVIPRFLLVGSIPGYGLESGLRKVPTLRSVLEYQASCAVRQ